MGSVVVVGADSTGHHKKSNINTAHLENTKNQKKKKKGLGPNHIPTTERARSRTNCSLPFITQKGAGGMGEKKMNKGVKIGRELKVNTK